MYINHSVFHSHCPLLTLVCCMALLAHESNYARVTACFATLVAERDSIRAALGQALTTCVLVRRKLACRREFVLFFVLEKGPMKHSKHSKIMTLSSFHLPIFRSVMRPTALDNSHSWMVFCSSPPLLHYLVNISVPGELWGPKVSLTEMVRPRLLSEAARASLARRLVRSVCSAPAVGRVVFLCWPSGQVSGPAAWRTLQCPSDALGALGNKH